LERRLIIHVGPHKTGTSYIQKQCVEYRELLNNNGVHYPRVGIRGFGHHEIVKSVRHEDWPSTEIFRQYKDETVDSEQILLSSENFSLFEKNDWSNFLDKDQDTKILCFVRPISDLLPSLWQTLIQNGSTFSFSEFYMSTRGYSELLHPMIHSYKKQLNSYLDIFGEENISLFEYAEIIKNKNDIFETLVKQTFDIDVSVEDKSYFNESRSFYRIELLRLLNVMFELNEQKKPIMDVRTALRNCSKALKNEIQHFTTVMEPYVLQYDLSAARDEDRDFEEYLTSKFKNQITHNPEGYFPVKNRKKINTFSGKAYQDPSVIQALQEIYQHIVTHMLSQKAVAG